MHVHNPGLSQNGRLTRPCSNRCAATRVARRTTATMPVSHRQPASLHRPNAYRDRPALRHHHVRSRHYGVVAGGMHLHCKHAHRQPHVRHQPSSMRGRRHSIAQDSPPLRERRAHDFFMGATAITAHGAVRASRTLACSTAPYNRPPTCGHGRCYRIHLRPQYIANEQQLLSAGRGPLLCTHSDVRGSTGCPVTPHGGVFVLVRSPVMLARVAIRGSWTP